MVNSEIKLLYALVGDQIVKDKLGISGLNGRRLNLDSIADSHGFETGTFIGSRVYDIIIFDLGLNFDRNVTNPLSYLLGCVKDALDRSDSLYSDGYGPVVSVIGNPQTLRFFSSNSSSIQNFVFPKVEYRKDRVVVHYDPSCRLLSSSAITLDI